MNCVSLYLRSPASSVLPAAKLSWIVCPLLTMVSGRSVQLILSGGWRAAIAPVISMADCWSPIEHGASLGSRPHLSGPVAPSWLQR
jgi:hypothetical protein